MVGMTRHFNSLLFASLSLFACSKNQTENPTGAAAPRDKPKGTIQAEISSDPRFAFSALLNRIWRVSNAPYGPASGSIYLFLPNGTLLETSCVETYRIAAWSVDKTQPDTLRVVEDQQAVFTASLAESTGSTLHLRKKLLLSGEVQDITLTAVDGEFVCPDLPK
jgi:hypothetical protein